MTAKPQNEIAVSASLPHDVKHFFIIGAMKAGTTSLHEYLASHPEISACAIKEPRFFLDDAPSPQNRLDYEELFSVSPDTRWVFESSTGYTKFPYRQGVAERIYQAYPDAKLFYILRDPIDRIYSHYLHNFARGRENLSFRQAIQNVNEYIDVSRYYLQLSQYLNFFSAGQILVLILEEMSHDTQAVLRAAYEFLGVDRGFEPHNLKAVYHATQSRRMLPPWLQRWSFRMREREQRSTIDDRRTPPRTIIDRALQPLLRAIPTKESIRDPVAEKMIARELKDDVSQLQEYLGRSLTRWPTVRESRTA